MKLFFSFFFLLLVQQIQAATYYIDFASGSDANNGTSTATPFQHTPGDTAATGTAASTTPVAGDTIKFKGGVEYTNEIAFNWSGTVGGGYIKYDGNWAGDWGTGRAIFDRRNKLNGTAMAASAARYYIWIQGFEIRNVGGDADDATNVISAAAGTYTNTVNTGGIGINFSTQTGNSNIFISDIYGHRLGGWRNSIGWTENTIQGGLLFVRDSYNITISNVHAIKMKNPIGLYTSTGMLSNVLVVSCNLSNYITWGIDMAGQQNGGVFANITIKDNLIHDYEQYASGNWLGSGDWPHTDGIFARTTGLNTTETNINIFNNHFYCDGNPGGGGTASIYISQGFSVNVYSNLFNQDSQTRMVGVDHLMYPGKKQWVYITNNTFITAGSPAVTVCCETNPATKTVVILNNIFRQTTGSDALYTMVNQLDGIPITTMNYNLYYDPDFAVGVKNIFAGPGPDYTKLGTLFADYGYEANGVYSDPLFVDFSATPSLRDLRLQSGSPARGMAQNGGDAGYAPYEALAPAISGRFNRGLNINQIRGRR